MDDPFKGLFETNASLVPGGPALPKLPVQYEVEVVLTGGPGDAVKITAYGATQDDAEAVAEFTLRVRERLYVTGDGE